MNEIKRFLGEWMTSMRLRAAKRRHDAIRQQAKDAIQATEHGGGLYLAYNGRPLVRAQDLRKDLPAALKDAREAWADYTEGRTQDTRL